MSAEKPAAAPAAHSCSGCKTAADSCCAWLSLIAPPALVLLVILYVYGALSVFVLLPQLQHVFGGAGAGAAKGDEAVLWGWDAPTTVVIVAIFHLLFIMCLVCMIRSTFSDPGHIPQTDIWRSGRFHISKHDEERLAAILSDRTLTPEQLYEQKAFIQSMPVVERKKNAELRMCKECQMYKPDRTHHCKICGECVLRMDHHCPWVANCIGFGNYKFFLLFLFYAWASAIFAVVLFMKRVIHAFRPVVDWTVFFSEDVPVLVAVILAGGLFIALMLFWWSHMEMTMAQTTTIEQKEKMTSQDPLVKHRWAVANLKYHRGSGYRNLRQVLGSPWMWLLPIASDRAGTAGTYSEVPFRDPDDSV